MPLRVKNSFAPQEKRLGGRHHQVESIHDRQRQLIEKLRTHRADSGLGACS
jgi:hypothetical protein